MPRSHVEEEPSLGLSLQPQPGFLSVQNVKQRELCSSFSHGGPKFILSVAGVLFWDGQGTSTMHLPPHAPFRWPPGPQRRGCRTKQTPTATWVSGQGGHRGGSLCPVRSGHARLWSPEAPLGIAPSAAPQPWSVETAPRKGPSLVDILAGFQERRPALIGWCGWRCWWTGSGWQGSQEH